LLIQLRRLACTTAVIAALSVVPAAEAQAQQPEPSSSMGEVASADLEASVSSTLKANPGSVRTGPNTVLLEPGVMWVLPSEREASVRGLTGCPAGWLCGWTNADFAGGMMAIQQGTYVDYINWWWNTSTFEVRFCDHFTHCDLGPGTWNGISNSISSVLNNTSVLWAPFYSLRNKANYYAYRGSPASYVGAKWNDSFTEACAC
jgi:hypothetical protein